MEKFIRGIQWFMCRFKGKERKGKRKKRKSVKFKRKIQVKNIPTWKCWSLRYTDFNIEFTYGPSRERTFIGHNHYEDIYCVLPPCSRQERLADLEVTMDWECVHNRKVMLLDIRSQDDVRHILCIFLLAYWSKIEMEECDLVREIRARGINLGFDDFEYFRGENSQRTHFKYIIRPDTHPHRVPSEPIRDLCTFTFLNWKQI